MKSEIKYKIVLSLFKKKKKHPQFSFCYFNSTVRLASVSSSIVQAYLTTTLNAAHMCTIAFTNINKPPTHMHTHKSIHTLHIHTLFHYPLDGCNQQRSTLSCQENGWRNILPSKIAAPTPIYKSGELELIKARHKHNSLTMKFVFSTLNICFVLPVFTPDLSFLTINSLPLPWPLPVISCSLCRHLPFLFLLSSFLFPSSLVV